jgi:sugar lactone lactonase YvrE
MTELFSRRDFVKSLTASAAMGLITHGGSSEAVGRESLRRITRVAIHPAIGLARVGNSPDAFFFGPEVPGATPRGPFKDVNGAIAKQAARFRLYGYDQRGRVVAELTADLADIRWEIEVANCKAAWYGVDTAFDVPGAPSVARRNATVTDRSSLTVEAPPRSLAGAATGPVVLDGGRFQGVPISLGEVMTDADGRLIVLPASGAAHPGPNAPPLSGFADNDGWTDDTCDGPVHAEVRIGDKTFVAEPAWVVCGSPNYAPGIGVGLVTLYDAVQSALFEAGSLTPPATDFERDIWPIFARMNDLQWVNEGYLQKYGFGSPQDWQQPKWRRRLGNPSPQLAGFRQQIFALFRNPDFATVEPDLEPQLYGDKVIMPPNAVEPRQWFSLTPLQYWHLQNWANGQFTIRSLQKPKHLAGYPLQKRPAALDRAALDACLGGAFHPGVEFPWIARVPWIWTADMRLKSASNGPDRHDYGPELNAAVALSEDGPLGHLGAGSITQWMGVPWQADSSSCRYGYQKAISTISPGFWPARIPNGVLTEADYDIVMDTGRTLEERRAAFDRRQDWERFIAHPTSTPTLSMMVQEWYRLGMVAERRGPVDGKFPRQMKVESYLGYAQEPSELYPAWMTIPQLPMYPIVVANSDDNSLRSVDEEGRVKVLTLSAPLERPEGIARDRSGNLYVACMDSGTVKKVDPLGNVSTFAYGLDSPVGLAFDRRGNLYVANYVENGWIAAISPDGIMRSLIPPEAGLAFPIAVVISPDGALLASVVGSGSIARIDPVAGKILNSQWISGLNKPRTIAFDASQRLTVAISHDHTLRRYDLQGVPLPLSLQGARLQYPFGLAFDAKGMLYVSCSGGTLLKSIIFTDNVGFVSDFATDLPNPGGIVFNG